jgi:hypothetical protein
MLSLQEEIRALVNHDLDCSELSLRLTAMRAEMVDLIRQRNATGGIEACPSIAERQKQNPRPELRRRTPQQRASQQTTVAAKEEPGRSRVLSM